MRWRAANRDARSSGIVTMLGTEEGGRGENKGYNWKGDPMVGGFAQILNITR